VISSRPCWIPLLALLVGCAYRVEMTSTPLGAAVRLPDGSTLVTPATAEFKYRPFRRQTLLVSAPGYRAMTVRVRSNVVRSSRFVLDPFTRPAAAFGDRPRGEVHFRMVRAHGPVGTWDPDEEGLTE